MDGHSPCGRPHRFATTRRSPLPAYSDHHGPTVGRESSGSESDSSDDGGGRSPHGHQPTHATRRPQFASQNQNQLDRRRPTHLHATVYIDDPPYIPRDPPTRPSQQRYAPGGGHVPVQHPSDYRDRVPPLPPGTPSTEYSSRRGSPSGSEHSDGSRGSDDDDRRSMSSEESGRHVPQQRSMAGVFHTYEPTTPMPFNAERYPAYDAQARRIGLEHVRYDSAPHDPSGRSYYRPRTHTYPMEEPVYRPREEPSRREPSPVYRPPREEPAYRPSRRESSPVYRPPPREETPVYIPPREGASVYRPPRRGSPVYRPDRAGSPVYRDETPVYHPPREEPPVYRPPREEPPVYRPTREHSPVYHPPREEYVHRPPREEYVHRPPREEYVHRPPREDYEPRSHREDYLRRPSREEYSPRPPREEYPQEDYAQRREEYARRPPSPSRSPTYEPMSLDQPGSPPSRYEPSPAPQYDPSLVPPSPRRNDRYVSPTSPEKPIVALEYTESYRAQAMRPSPPPASPEEAPEEEVVTLDMLADPAYAGQKPNYPYPTLVKAAILSSPKGRLTLQEIYQALMDRFSWFKDNAKDKAWQNSIRHNLSLNKMFRKMPREITEPGKGSYWTVDFEAGAGNKRERKRNKRPTKAEREQRVAASSSQAGDHGSSAEEASVPLVSGTETQTLAQSMGHEVAFQVAVAPLEDNIDPALRAGAHVAGQGRTRGTKSGATQRNNARRRQSPYTRPAPAPPPQPVFGQPSLQPSFTTMTFQPGVFTPGAMPSTSSSASASAHVNARQPSKGPSFRVTMPTTGRPSGRPPGSTRGAAPSMSTVTTQAQTIPVAPILQPTLHPSLGFAAGAGPSGCVPGDIFGLGLGAASGSGYAQGYRQSSVGASSTSSQG